MTSRWDENKENFQTNNLSLKSFFSELEHSVCVLLVIPKIYRLKHKPHDQTVAKKTVVLECITGTKKGGVYTCSFLLFHNTAIYIKLVVDQVYDEFDDVIDCGKQSSFRVWTFYWPVITSNLIST